MGRPQKPSHPSALGTLDMLILSRLARGTEHGFGIAEYLRQISDAALSVEEGPLYPALHRLEAQGFVTAKEEWQPFATPRRLAVLIEGVLDRQPEQAVERKGPAVASGIGADGKATKALEGFARSCGVAVDVLERMKDGKAEYFVFRTRKPGEDLRPLPGGASLQGQRCEGAQQKHRAGQAS